MMGGFGSGRPPGPGRYKVEYCRSIDVNWLNKSGLLSPGHACGLQWGQDGKQSAIIRLIAEPDWLHLSYRVRTASGDWEPVEEPVRIVHVPCRFGGTRPYFKCPGIVNGVPCARRVVKLYWPSRYFVCRHCNRLAYMTQSEDWIERTMARASKIRTRLGGNPELLLPFPERPKGMWKRTYIRLRQESVKHQMRADIAIETRFDVLKTRLDEIERKRLQT